MNNSKIAVIGAGKWGQALHFALSQKQKCLITSRTKKDIENFVPLEEALNCEYLVIAIPAQQIRQWLKDNFVYSDQKVLVAAKGIEASTGAFLKEIYEEYVPSKNLGFISGPSFAAEVVKGLPAAIVINSTSKKFYNKFSPYFPEFLKTYYSKDVIGAEIAGAYKNVLAIASGICEGLHLGNNARASLISRGLVEMERFGRHYGAKKKTFIGLSGAGDLFLTASSTLSRNFRVGLGLAKNKTLDEILEELGEVAEGVMTSKAIYNLSSKNNIYTPIANEVKLILEGKDPKDSLRDLLSS
jgi:glycerol-3-phosphate dehydrogenase (NAD(P)+)